MPIVSAHDVAAQLRRRQPGLPTKKLHKLLYYCQGHHLAAFDQPLFEETISAWDMGPVVGKLWHREKHDDPAPEPTALDEAQLNTIGYVLSRYGALSGTDLQHLTHNELPYVQADQARSPGTTVRIDADVIAAYFRQEALEDAEPEFAPLDSDTLSDWLQGAPERAQAPRRRDSLDELRARLETGRRPQPT